MAALTSNRSTNRKAGADHNDPVSANVRIFQGALVVLSAAGNAQPGTTATGLKVRGIAQEEVNNLGGSAGDKVVNTRTGVHCLANDGSVTRAHIGGTAYIVDDQTVAATDGSGTRSAAGAIDDVDTNGVWVVIVDRS